MAQTVASGMVIWYHWLGAQTGLAKTGGAASSFGVAARPPDAAQDALVEQSDGTQPCRHKGNAVESAFRATATGTTA